MLTRVDAPHGSIRLRWKDSTGHIDLIPTRTDVLTIHFDRGDAEEPAAVIARHAFEWARIRGYRKILAFIPATNRASLIAAVQAGMTREGYSPQSYFEEGEAEDVVYYGVDLCQVRQ